MSTLSDSTRSAGATVSQGQDGYFEISDGWNRELFNETNRVFENKDLILSLIKLANEKVSLKTIFPKYNIKFEEKYSPSGWTHRAICPFPDHKERTPSFHYNPAENRFNCFGCSKGGGPVNFLAHLENKKFGEIAKALLNDNFEPDEILEQVDNIEDQYNKLILELTDRIYEFNESENFSREAVDFSEKVMWALDSYMRNHLRSRSCDLEQIKSRIQIIKEYLENFKMDN